ncbi:hypothetical protein V1477_001752, partial [Vespula maculifrons]
MVTGKAGRSSGAAPSCASSWRRSFPIGPPTSFPIALAVVDKEGSGLSRLRCYAARCGGATRFRRASISLRASHYSQEEERDESSGSSRKDDDDDDDDDDNEEEKKRGEGILAVVAIALLAALVEGFSPNPGGIPSAPRRIPSVEFRNSLPKSGRRVCAPIKTHSIRRHVLLRDHTRGCIHG